MNTPKSRFAVKVFAGGVNDAGAIHANTRVSLLLIGERFYEECAAIKAHGGQVSPVLPHLFHIVGDDESGEGGDYPMC